MKNVATEHRVLRIFINNCPLFVLDQVSPRVKRGRVPFVTEAWALATLKHSKEDEDV